MQYTLKRKTNGSKQKDYKQYYVNYTFIFKKSFKYLKKKNSMKLQQTRLLLHISNNDRTFFCFQF